MKKCLLLSLISFMFLLSYGQDGGAKFFDLAAGYEANGAFTRIAYSYFHKADQLIRIGAQFHLEELKSDPQKVPVQLYLLSLEYQRGILYLGQGDWTVYAGGGMLGGYESVNHGHALLSNGQAVNAHSRWLYGATAGVELDKWITWIEGIGRHAKSLQFFINTKINYYPNSQIGTLQPNFTLGLRLGF